MADDAKKAKKEKKEKGGKSNLLPAVVVAVGLIGGGYFMGGGGGGGGTATATTVAGGYPAADAGHAAEGTDDHATSAKGGHEELDCAKEDIKKPPTEGAVYSLDAITVNLQEGHYLKVGIALVLDASKDKKKFEEEGAGKLALDPVIRLLGGRAIEEFESPRAIEAAKEELTEAIRPIFHCKVIEVNFTEFVVL
jgi:flagellar basal body-associated protein FliL